MKISTINEMRDLDRGAIENFGIEALMLMENAGIAVYDVIMKEFGVKGKRFVIFCGPGNNGGDGLVVARKILSSGGIPSVFLLCKSDDYKGVARQNCDIVKRLPVKIEEISTTDPVSKEIAHCDAIVDAILGTGITREVGGFYGEVIELINTSGKPVFSVDIPSGINGNTGEVMGVAVRADFTITFGLPKIGNILYPGFEHCGKLYVSHISFPPSHYSREEIRSEIGLPSPLPPRSREGHKGTFGQALFIAGARNYLGAPYFAALSFLKAGGGYSRLATPSSIAPFIANKGSEIVFLPQKETADGTIAVESASDILAVANMMDIAVIGPGLSLHPETQDLVRSLVPEIAPPLIVDGDGITAISGEIELVKKRREATVLTPHPGEMSRITGRSVKEILKDRIDILRSTASDLGCIIILKGAHSLVGYPDGRVAVNMTGNPGMGSAGSGDVLTGTIAAMYCLGLDIERAAFTGVFVHGLAGDLAAGVKGEDGITAQDILDFLPEAVRQLRENYGELTDNYYGSVFTI